MKNIRRGHNGCRQDNEEIMFAFPSYREIILSCLKIIIKFIGERARENQIFIIIRFLIYDYVLLLDDVHEAIIRFSNQTKNFIRSSEDL